MIDSATQATVDQALASEAKGTLTQSQAALLHTYEWWLEERAVSKVAAC